MSSWQFMNWKLATEMHFFIKVGNASNGVWFEFDLNLTFEIWFGLIWTTFSTFENVWIWSEKFEFDFKHGKIINLISFDYFPGPELTNFILLLHENTFWKVFAEKWGKFFQIFEIIWRLNLTYQNLIWFEFDIFTLD